MATTQHLAINWYLFIYIIPTLIGGFLAGMAMFGVSWLELRRKKKWFAEAIKDDLEKSIVLYQNIMNDWGKDNTVWYVTIDEIIESRKVYEQSGDYLLGFPKNIRRRINNYYLQSKNAVVSLKIMQQRKYELDNQYWKHFAKIKENKKSKSDDAIRQEILESKLFRESQEWNLLSIRLPNSIQGLLQFKIEAQSILDLLPS